MCGDFFHKRSVPPETMNYAVAGLQLLRDAGIPVVAIEGNHDQKHTDSDYSWLRSLANWNLLHLLEPSNEEGKISYKPWDAEYGKGGYIDVGRARIFGSHWYGAAANWAIPMLTSAIGAESPRRSVPYSDASHRRRGPPDASDPGTLDLGAKGAKASDRIRRPRPHAYAL